MSPWDDIRRRQAVLRNYLTRGERLVFYSWIAALLVLPSLGGVLIVVGRHTTRDAGIGLLCVALAVTAIPVSRILSARVRRREAAQPRTATAQASPRRPSRRSS